MALVKRVESEDEGLSLPPNVPMKRQREKTKESNVYEGVSLRGVSHGSLLWKTTPQSISPSVSAN